VAAREAAVQEVGWAAGLPNFFKTLPSIRDHHSTAPSLQQSHDLRTNVLPGRLIHEDSRHTSCNVENFLGDAAEDKFLDS